MTDNNKRLYYPYTTKYGYLNRNLNPLTTDELFWNKDDEENINDFTADHYAEIWHATLQRVKHLSLMYKRTRKEMHRLQRIILNMKKKVKAR